MHNFRSFQYKLINSIKMFPRYLFPCIYLFTCSFIQVSYQQSFVGTTKQDLTTFCLENHTMSNTLQTFWHDAGSDCELEPRRLLTIYSQLLKRPAAEEDQCSILLSHQLRKKIITILATKLEEDFITKSLNNNRELKELLNNVHEIDKRVSQVIWERVLNEIYLFVDNGEIIEQLMQWNSEEIQVLGLQLLLSKNQLELQHNDNLLSLLTYHLSNFIKSKTLPASNMKTLQRFYSRLPKSLRLFYEYSENDRTGLLNYGHWEYLYPARDNLPDFERRMPLTWSREKNTTDSDGHLLIDLNSKGLAAIGSRFTGHLTFLYADSDKRGVYFWIGAGSKETRWWHVISHGLDPYLIFQNNDTQDLLCATTEYDENRRYVALLSGSENMDNSACHWLVNYF